MTQAPASDLLKRAVRKAKRTIVPQKEPARAGRTPQPPITHSLDRNRNFSINGDAGFIDSFAGSPLPVVLVEGWFLGAELPPMELELEDGRTIQPRISRTFRPDVQDKFETDPFQGFSAHFLLKEAKPSRLMIGNRAIDVPNASEFCTVDPHYGDLLDTASVQHRADIYGQGPTLPSSPEILALCGSMHGKVLDFGCGNGDLVRWLRRERGLDAVGIELDTDRIRTDILPEVADAITLYGGGTPLPYEDGLFDAIIATEVIEHVPGFQEFVPEFLRILKPGGLLYITVPDISSIPLSSITGTVPWHLLEATHVNFFTHESLEASLAPFKILERFQLCSVVVSDRTIPGSLGAIYEAPA